MLFFIYIIFICSKLWSHPRRVFYLFKHRIIIIIFTPFSEKYAIKKVIVLNNLISFESIDQTTYIWNDCQCHCQYAINFQWIKTRSISKAVAFCYRNRLNGNLNLRSIEGPIWMTYVVILFSPVAKKAIFFTYRFCRKKKNPYKWPFFLLDAQISFIPFPHPVFLFLRSALKNLKISNLNCTL